MLRSRQYPPEDDPYWDPPEEHLIGKAYYSLKALGLLFDNPFDVHIISTQGCEAGTLRMNIIPIDFDETEGPETPEEVIDSPISFEVEIAEALGLPSSHSNNVYCSYEFWKEENRTTQTIPMHNENPVFNYKEAFNEIYVDEALCNYMQNNMLSIKVFGTGMAMRVEDAKSNFKPQQTAQAGVKAEVPPVEEMINPTNVRANPRQTGTQRQVQAPPPQQPQSKK